MSSSSVDQDGDLDVDKHLSISSMSSSSVDQDVDLNVDLNADLDADLDVNLDADLDIYLAEHSSISIDLGGDSRLKSISE